MCKIIAITNQKGGCSKTTSTVNIGIGLARAGKSVLLIDADAQGSLTASLGFKRPDEIGITLATIMAKTINEEDIELKRAILKHEEGVDLIPGNIELSGLEVQLSNVLSRELILKEFVDSIREEYEYILIDCAPSLGMMTINALVAADEVIIPVQAAYLPVKGLQQLIKTINMVKRRLNKKLQSKNIVDAIQNVFNSKLLKKVNKIKDRGNYMEQKAEFHYLIFIQLLRGLMKNLRLWSYQNYLC